MDDRENDFCSAGCSAVSVSPASVGDGLVSVVGSATCSSSGLTSGNSDASVASDVG